MTSDEIITELHRQAALYGYETEMAVCLLVPTEDRQNTEEKLMDITAIEARFTPNAKRRVAIFTEEP